jgi:hypothetical protein
VSERPAGAEFLLLVVEPVVLPAVSVPLERSVADDEREDDEGDGLGHKLLYTNCSGAPLQAVTDPALNVPFG